MQSLRLETGHYFFYTHKITSIFVGGEYLLLSLSGTYECWQFF